MNLYKFECTIWVRGETVEAALKELHDEALYHHLQDNNLCGLESDEGELVESIAEQADELADPEGAERAVLGKSDVRVAERPGDEPATRRPRAAGPRAPGG